MLLLNLFFLIFYAANDRWGRELDQETRGLWEGSRRSGGEIRRPRKTHNGELHTSGTSLECFLNVSSSVRVEGHEEAAGRGTETATGHSGETESSRTREVIVCPACWSDHYVFSRYSREQPDTRSDTSSIRETSKYQESEIIITHLWEWWVSPCVCCVRD